MQLLGQPVRHNAFGTGVITGLSGEYHYDRLWTQGKNRLYSIRTHFSRFLTLKDAGKQNEIRAGYERRLRAERAERQKELERQERLGKIRSMKVTPYSQAAFDIPWKEAKAAAEADAVSTGFYLSGYSKDRPRIPSRLKPNSACLLTTLETGCEEKERRILGAFMVRDDFWGRLLPGGRDQGARQIQALSAVRQYVAILELLLEQGRVCTALGKGGLQIFLQPCYAADIAGYVRRYGRYRPG